MNVKMGLLAACAFAGGVLVAGGIQPTDQVAVAETANKGGLPAETVEAFSDMLESEIEVGRLVTRAGLKQMMTEIGFTASSDLVNPSETQMAKLGQVKGVKYLVLPTVSKFGSRYTLAIRVVESSTGVILPGGKASQSFNTLDEMADVLPGLLERIGLKGSAAAPGASAAPAGFKAAVLTPLIKVGAPPDYLKENLNVYLEQMLIENGIRLQNLKSVDEILRKNGIGALDKADPSLYRRIGQLLGVDKLVQATVTRFDVVQQSQYIAVTRQTVVTCTGVIEGNVRIVSAQSGDVIASFPFEQPAQLSGGVDAADYGRSLLKAAIAPLTAQIVPRLK